MGSSRDSTQSGSGHPALQRRFGLLEAIDSPCQDCSAGCCVYVPLRDFTVRELTELDYARYLLNFDRIELTLHSGGLWRAHYVHPCRHLDQETDLCRVHNTKRQPLTCKTFNAWQCSYKRIYDGPDTPEAIRIDRNRLEHLASMLVFDGYRRIIEAPSMEALLESLPPLEPTAWPEAPESQILEEWKQAVVEEKPEPTPREHGFQMRPDPCSDCAAWCCTRLNFPQQPPNNEANLEHLRFLAGFPGVELGHGPEGWTAVVRTTCRHRLVTPHGVGRCGVYDQPERPIACQTYQESSCAYKARFGQTHPAFYTRITYESLDAVLALYRLDDHGYIRQQPGFAEIREAVEQDWIRR